MMNLWNKLLNLFRKKDIKLEEYSEMPSPETIALLIKTIEDSKKPKKRKYVRKAPAKTSTKK
jgi:hypothetical protein